jgi:hypothetical protein
VAALVMVKNRISPGGLEIRVLDRLREIVAALPEKSADLYIDEDRDPKARVPGWHFRVTPSKQHSACIQGLVDSSFGIYFTIGEATAGEIFLASRSSKTNEMEEERFFAICRAVFTTHFSEDVTYSSTSNRVLRSRIMLRVDERTIRIGGHQLFGWLYPRRTTKHFSYEPYY